MKPTLFIKKIMFLIVVIFFITSMKAQNNDFIFHYKIENNNLYVRWIPQTIASFKYATQKNMTLGIYSIKGAFSSPEFQLVEQEKLQPLDLSTWKEELNNTIWDTVAITSIYGEELGTQFLNKTFLAKEYEDNEQEAWLFRHGFNNMALSYEWSAIERSGLGFTRPLDEGVSMYALKLYPTAAGDTLFFDINIDTYQVPEVPELQAVFKDKNVELKWRTLEYRNDFFAWYLDRSLDNGKTWEAVFDIPLMNNYDTITGADESLKSLYHTDHLPENDVEVLYRLQGADFLGGRSENYSIVTGEGHDDIITSPLMLETIQTDSNYAIIQWEYDETFNPLLEEFRIVVTDTTGKNYRVALEGIDPSQRSAAVYMKYRSNFFRVQAVSKQGTVLTSFESLVMMYDVTPPAVPGDFEGYIDSLGAAHFSWIVSDEFDLAGYYLFKGYFKEEEKAMITPDPLIGPTHIDSVDMETGNEWVYYQLRSVDTRGNGSAFTPILELKKPDIFPPAAARIVEADNNGKKVFLRWVSSPSLDAQTYNLYRKIVDEENEWSLLLSFDKDNYINTYTDSLVQLGKTYAYTTQVIDDDGLVSNYAQPVSLRLKDYGVRAAIESFNATTQVENKNILLNWTYSKSPREYYLYRGKGDQPLSLLKVLSGDKVQYLDESLHKGETYRYVLRAIFANGNVSPYTEQLEVLLE